MKLSLRIDNKEHFAEVCRFAARTGQMPQLRKKLAWLGSGSCWGHEAVCVLYKDFAPYSFEFAMMTKKDNKFIYNGGLIYHGKHDNGGDGSFPTFSVNLEKTEGWAIHT